MCAGVQIITHRTVYVTMDYYYYFLKLQCVMAATVTHLMNVNMHCIAITFLHSTDKN